MRHPAPKHPNPYICLYSLGHFEAKCQILSNLHILYEEPNEIIKWATEDFKICFEAFVTRKYVLIEQSRSLEMLVEC